MTTDSATPSSTSPGTSPGRAARIEALLREAFAPSLCRVEDDSARHKGHAGVRQGPGHAGYDGETHFTVTLVSEAFRGLSRVARQRRVYEILAGEFKGGLHALALNLRTSDER